MAKEKVFLNGVWIELDENDGMIAAWRKALREAENHADINAADWRKYVSGKAQSKNRSERKTEQPYVFSFDVDEKTYEALTGRKRGCYGDAEETDEGPSECDGEDLQIAFVHNGHKWYAPEGWDVYSRGEIAGSQLRIGKGSQINTNTFQSLPYQMVDVC